MRLIGIFNESKIDVRGQSGRTYFLIMGVIGLLMILIGVSSVLKAVKELELLERTDATITALDTRGRKPHKTRVEYEVNGETYTATLESYYITYRVGNRLPVAYDAKNPSRVQLAGFGRLLKEGVFGIAGLILVIGCATSLYRFHLKPMLQRKKQEKKDRTAPWET